MRNAAIIVVLWISGLAAAEEAVSDLNGKVGYAGGSMEGDWGNNVSASGSLPVTSNVGFQADWLYTDVSDREFLGSAAHLFWRDPQKGLLGLVGGGVDEEDIDSLRGGVEGEYYLEHFTLTATAGVASLEYDDGPFPFIDDDVTDFFGGAGIRYYPLDNLMLSVSYLHVFDNELVLGMAEYQTPIHGLSVFAQIADGEHGYDHALFGVQFYIGRAKSLIQRHRSDDPQNLVPDILYGIGVYGAEFNGRAREYAETHPGAQGSSGNYGVHFSTGSNVSEEPPEDWEEP